MKVDLVGIRINNMRGFDNARLSLDRDLTLLVGPNNSGKTSVLRILDWLINEADEALLLGSRPLTADELTLLRPARDTRNAARRITLRVHIADGRRWRRFQCDSSGIADLRIGYAGAGLRLNLGAPRRNETADSGRALELWRALRSTTEMVLIPAARDAASSKFIASLREAVVAKLAERAVHERGGGSPAEYRVVKKAVDAINEVADELVAPLWAEMARAIPPGLAKEGRLRANMEPRKLVEWLSGQVEFRIITGSHDARSVEPVQVGSGLQSLLELALRQPLDSVDGKRILAVEEPEAFLHPSAQRSLARLLADDSGGQRIISTHSPLLVDEARYGDVVLVRDHRFFEPRDADDTTRDQINTALLTAAGSEMAFAEGVLLVEGPGDRAYFEGIRRRLAGFTSDGRLDCLSVVVTGSKDHFGPWLRLLASYGEVNDRPVSWLSLVDADAATSIIDGHRNAGLAVQASVRRLLDEVRSAPADDARDKAASRVNVRARQLDQAIHMAVPDLEGLMVAGWSPEAVRRNRDLLGAGDCDDSGEIALWLRNRKHPWLRAQIARDLPPASFTVATRELVLRWLELVMPRTEAVSLWRRFVAS